MLSVSLSFNTLRRVCIDPIQVNNRDNGMEWNVNRHTRDAQTVTYLNVIQSR